MQKLDGKKKNLKNASNTMKTMTILRQIYTHTYIFYTQHLLLTRVFCMGLILGLQFEIEQ